MARKTSLSVMVLAALLAAASFTSVMVPALAAAGVSEDKKDVEYTCPMHPEVRSKTAGRCPKCNMYLVAVHPDPPPAKPARWGADYFPNVPLVTQDGKTVRFYDDLLKDKIVAIDLIYTHCQDACPLETARLAQVQRMLGDRVGKDIFFYSITIDPKRDTPAVLKDYAEKFHAGPGWLFLTGKTEDIELISKKLGLYSPQAGRDGHSPMLMLGDVAAGQWMRNSAVDNARFLEIQIRQFLDTWATRQPVPMQSYAAAAMLPISSPGQYLFSSRCTVCHTIGAGDSMGPDLQGVTKRRDRQWLSSFIAAPDQMMAKGDPIATSLKAAYRDVQMPNLRLTEEDVNALIDYLESRSTGPQVSGNARAQRAEAGAQR